MIQSKIDTFHRNAWCQAIEHLLSSQSCSNWAVWNQDAPHSVTGCITPAEEKKQTLVNSDICQILPITDCPSPKNKDHVAVASKGAGEEKKS